MWSIKWLGKTWKAMAFPRKYLAYHRIYLYYVMAHLFDIFGCSYYFTLRNILNQFIINSHFWAHISEIRIHWASMNSNQVKIMRFYCILHTNCIVDDGFNDCMIHFLSTIHYTGQCTNTSTLIWLAI